MEKEKRDYLELTYRSINCFANDGKLDVHELDRLIAIAMKDGVIDANEKRVLENIIGRLTPSELSAEMSQKVNALRAQMS
ncbi:hypothetical protein [Permianibacter aggregans]|uniref:Tellurite resistance protein TerB n=1 Tax=Permianibacter aggregans TaxID=1510150 RepID=A0A4R6UGE1_9GAMM|nr:hypothetical protein [Permianibacter aggregans]QGX38507.1 hypothetical protein E2H98_02020 [Permianibacter aggregans]TDQ45066.1 hypothetical protein EV696_12126 [Permianibacter aggregans]